MRLLRAVSLVVCAVFFLNGCAGVLIAAGVAGSAAYLGHDRRTVGTFVEDENIELKSLYLLNKDIEPTRFGHINTISFNQNVLLVGQVPDSSTKDRAEAIVKGISGVRQVYNELTVAGNSSTLMRSSDTVITSKVKSKMLSELPFDPTRIKVVTENGIVYLMGIVNRKEAEIAIQVARYTGGVQKVVPIFEYI